MPRSSTVITPRASDVITGRGKGSFNRPGNRRFLHLVSQSVCRYKTATKSEKSVIAWQIIEDIQSSGGRFLGKKGDRFVELDEGKKVAKTTHAFRDWKKEASEEPAPSDNESQEGSSDDTSPDNSDAETSPAAAAPSPSRSKRRGQSQTRTAPRRNTTNKKNEKRAAKSKTARRVVKCGRPQRCTARASTSTTPRRKMTAKGQEELNDFQDQSLDGEKSLVSEVKTTAGVRTRRSRPDGADQPVSSRTRLNKTAQTDEKKGPAKTKGVVTKVQQPQSKRSSSATTEQEVERKPTMMVNTDQPSMATSENENPPSLARAGFGPKEPPSTILVPHRAQTRSNVQPVPSPPSPRYLVHAEALKGATIGTHDILHHPHNPRSATSNDHQGGYFPTPHIQYQPPAANYYLHGNNARHGTSTSQIARTPWSSASLGAPSSRIDSGNTLRASTFPPNPPFPPDQFPPPGTRNNTAPHRHSNHHIFQGVASPSSRIGGDPHAHESLQLSSFTVGPTVAYDASGDGCKQRNNGVEIHHSARMEFPRLPPVVLDAATINGTTSMESNSNGSTTESSSMASTNTNGLERQWDAFPSDGEDDIDMPLDNCSCSSMDDERYNDSLYHQDEYYTQRYHRDRRVGIH